VGSNVPLVRVRNNRLEAEAPAGALGAEQWAGRPR
jgi:hypothetical protein